MNETNRKAVWKAIQTTGDLLVGRLPESSRHPSGRNPYAHAALCVKNKFGCSYKVQTIQYSESTNFSFLKNYVSFSKVYI